MPYHTGTLSWEMLSMITLIDIVGPSTMASVIPHTAVYVTLALLSCGEYGTPGICEFPHVTGVVISVR